LPTFRQWGRAGLQLKIATPQSKTVLISCQQQNYRESHDAVPIWLKADKLVLGIAIPKNMILRGLSRACCPNFGLERPAEDGFYPRGVVC